MTSCLKALKLIARHPKVNEINVYNRFSIVIEREKKKNNAPTGIEKEIMSCSRSCNIYCRFISGTFESIFHVLIYKWCCVTLFFDAAREGGELRDFSKMIFNCTRRCVCVAVGNAPHKIQAHLSISQTLRREKSVRILRLLATLTCFHLICFHSIVIIRFI